MRIGKAGTMNKVLDLVSNLENRSSNNDTELDLLTGENFFTVLLALV